MYRNTKYFNIIQTQFVTAKGLKLRALNPRSTNSTFPTNLRERVTRCTRGRDTRLGLRFALRE